MNTLIETTGTGSIEHSGTGSIEHAGTGSIEHTGTGNIEHSGTGSIEHSGTGSIARRLALSAALACVFSGAALAETASYDTSRGTIDVHSNGSEVRISWHYDDGASRGFLVGTGNLTADYGLIRLRPVDSFKVASDGTSNDPDKVASDGTSNGSSYEPTAPVRGTDGRQFDELGVPVMFQKVASDGTSNGSSIGGAWGGEMELIFTDRGIEAVATMGNESIVLDLNNSGEFSQAVVFLGAEAL